MNEHNLLKITEVCNKISCFYPKISTHLMKLLNNVPKGLTEAEQYDYSIALVNGLVAQKIAEIAYQ